MRGPEAKPLPDRAPMALTLAVWLCTVPFVLLLLGPLFGLKVAALAAAGLLVALAMICSGVCATKAGTS